MGDKSVPNTVVSGYSSAKSIAQIPVPKAKSAAFLEHGQDESRGAVLTCADIENSLSLYQPSFISHSLAHQEHVISHLNILFYWSKSQFAV
jgi:hypothetical protein